MHSPQTARPGGKIFISEGLGKAWQRLGVRGLGSQRLGVKFLLLTAEAWGQIFIIDRRYKNNL